jgi:hypothetical protein
MVLPLQRTDTHPASPCQRCAPASGHTQHSKGRSMFTKVLFNLHRLQHAQVEEFADKQKELESTIQPIMTRLYQGACGPSDCYHIYSSCQRPDSSLRKIYSINSPHHAEADLVGFNTIMTAVGAGGGGEGGGGGMPSDAPGVLTPL